MLVLMMINTYDSTKTMKASCIMSFKVQRVPGNKKPLCWVQPIVFER